MIDHRYLFASTNPQTTISIASCKGYPTFTGTNQGRDDGRKYIRSGSAEYTDNVNDPKHSRAFQPPCGLGGTSNRSMTRIGPVPGNCCDLFSVGRDTIFFERVKVDSSPLPTVHPRLRLTRMGCLVSGETAFRVNFQA
jgi:hypothetical protein